MKNRMLWQVLVFFAVSSFLFILGFVSPVQAGVKCDPEYCADNCQPVPKNNSGTEFASEGDPGAYKKCCGVEGDCTYQAKCSVSGSATCGNCAWFIDEEECSCTPVTCENIPGDKFRTREETTNGRTCADPCKPQTTTCHQYKNAPPTCSMLPKNIILDRTDVPKQFELTVTDQDYGDTVQITAIRTINGTQVNSCVKVTTLTGADWLNLPVRTGSNDPTKVSQTTALLADPRGLHGVFENVGGLSKCEGDLEVEIRDIDSDGPEGPDVSDTVKCSIKISVRNDAPRLTGVNIRDQDQLTGVAGIPEQEDMFDRRADLYVGSPLSKKPQEEVRASVCSKPLGTTQIPLVCKKGDEVYHESYSKKRNPFIFEFTVADGNGVGDIMQAGIWLQQVSQSATIASLPIVDNGSRNSIQAMYSEKENMQVASNSNRWNFVSRACIGNACGPKELHASSKQIFSALGYIPHLPDRVPTNGNIKQGDTAWASSKDWQKVGFPDCLDTTTGCLNVNVPTNAQTSAPLPGGNSSWANYEWSVVSDENHLVCYKSNSPVPSVVEIPVGDVCPSNCAACTKKLGVTALNSNSLRFSFKLYFNDRDGVDGMEDGDYAVFVSALDKVSATLNNVTSKGNDDGWTRFTKSGEVCTGTTCPTGEDFTLVYDSTPPEVTVEISGASAGPTITMITRATDATSGVSGITNRHVGEYVVIEGVPEDEVIWAQKMGGAPFDGSNDHITYSRHPRSITNSVQAKGLTPNSFVDAGTCAYDMAGNMRCSGSSDTYKFKASWLKTSYGDVYSKEGVVLTMPSDDSVTNDATRSLKAPFNSQIFTFATGFYLTSRASENRLHGGHMIGSTMYGLGFLDNYRTSTSSNAFNIFSYLPNMPGNEYTRLKSTASLNCDRLNAASTTGKKCDNSTGSTLNVSDNTIVTLNGNTDWSDQIVNCQKINVVFVKAGTLLLSNVTSSGVGACLFVVGPGASIELVDKAAQGRVDSKPQADAFEAAIVSDGGSVKFGKSIKSSTGADFLKVTGFIYSSSSTPLFLRDLAQVDIPRYPAEWLMYDSNLLDSLRPLLGNGKTADLACGVSTHVLCK